MKLGWNKPDVEHYGYWPCPPEKKLPKYTGTGIGVVLILAVILIAIANYKTDSEKFHQLTLVEKLNAWQALAERK